MPHTLTFESLQIYQTGKIGINIPIRLLHGSQLIDVDAKLDTGSTFCVFERLIGEDLGFDIESGMPEQIGTPLGAFAAFGHFVTLVVQGRECEVVVYFAENPAFNRNVLGRVGFLDRVLIGLNDYAGRLYLGRLDADEQDQE